MPKGKEYNSKNVGTGASRTPITVMGGQGKSVKIEPSHYKSRPTGNTPFPEGSKASGRGAAPNHKSKMY